MDCIHMSAPYCWWLAICMLGFHTKCSANAAIVYNRGEAGLTSVPADIVSTTEIVNLTYNQIAAISVDPFTSLASIYDLRLDHNRLQQMPSIESTADTLVEYSLSHNRIDSIPSYHFQNFLLLEYIDLSYNHIIVLERFTFYGTVSLHQLELEGNSINYTAVEAFESAGLTTLKYLKLHNNYLTAFPCFGSNRARGLVSIWLQNNEITFLPEECLAQLQNVSKIELVLTDNNISSIANLSTIIANITHLTIKDNNYLSDFPVVSQEVVESSHLTKLYMSRSSYAIFPDIQMRETLIELAIDDAQMACVPVDRVVGFDSLEILELQSNAMQRFPDPACDSQQQGNEGLIFPSLKLLLLHYNELVEFPDLAMFPNLEELRIDFNPIVQLEWQTVASVSGLQFLDLRDTWLQSVFCDYTPPGPPPFISNVTLFKLINDDLLMGNFGIINQPVYATDIPLLCVWQLPTNWTLPTHNSSGHALATDTCVSEAALQRARWVAIIFYDDACPEPETHFYPRHPTPSATRYKYSDQQFIYESDDWRAIKTRSWIECASYCRLLACHAFDVDDDAEKNCIIY